jgi:hypothetical protein
MNKLLIVLSVLIVTAISSFASGSHPTWTGKVGEIQVADWFVNVELITQSHGTLWYSFRVNKSLAPDYKDHLASLLFARQNDLPVNFYTTGSTGQGGLWEVAFVNIHKYNDMADKGGAAN